MLAVPIIVIVLPMILLVIRARPAGAVKSTVAEEVAKLPGLELEPALKVAPFWLLAFVQLTANMGLAACFYHTVPFLIHAGYAPQHAALLQGRHHGGGCAGKSPAWNHRGSIHRAASTALCPDGDGGGAAAA